MKRLGINAALVGATLTAVLMLYQLRYVGMLLAFAIMLAAAIRPGTTVLVRLRLPRWLALALAYVIATGAPVVLVVLLFPTLAAEFTMVADGVLPAYGRVLARWSAGGGGLGMLAGWLPPVKTLAGVVTHVRPATVAGGALQATRVVLEGVAAGVLVVMLSISWSVHGKTVLSGVAALIPARHRPVFRRLSADLGLGVGRHVFGEACQSLLSLAAVALSLAAAGAPVVVLPAVLVAGLRMVPIVGIGLAVAVVALALTPLGIGAAALGALGTWLLLLGLHVGVPRFLGAREYNTLLGAFVALLLATLIGWPGLILAPPLAAAIQIAIESLFRSRHATAGTLATVADVRARYAQLVAELQSKPWTSKRTLGLLDNLGHLLGDVEEIEPPPGPLPPPDQSPVLFGSVSP